ncbi:Flagellar M-ring protein [Methylophilaceae bacterium]|nr:Flagellar M-ring protein [Methylophilaceae bacterium]
MAANEATLNTGELMASGKSLMGGKLVLAIGAAAVIAFMAVVWLWSQQPDYRVLFSNYSDKDGGSVVAALEQMNIPFKFSEGGSAILVPSQFVHEARLKLASQGLPKGGNVGFELLENQKFGVSQFVEQVNFQRALEGELERSIQSVDAIQVARVHLAIPKSSVFTRDQKKPTASVLINLHAGRSLDQRQVSAIVHLVASSVPDLPVANVTIVDQNGSLLSDTSKQNGMDNLDPSKLKYIEELQRNIIKRVESIITPLVGANNVRAEASAEVDFSSTEQAAEIYKPNQAPDATTVRSMQSSESTSSTSTTAAGVPGALSNQPPVPATAPLVNDDPAADTGGTTVTTPVSSQRNVTTNYEVDKTVRYVQQPMGGIKRLTVAVVVNNITTTDKDGKVISRPLTDDEKTQINDLAKQAMGFNAERGDSLTVVNSSFAGVEQQVLPEIPLWKQPAVIDMAKEAGKFLLGIIIIFLLYLRLLKPMVRTLTTPATPMLPKPGDEDTVVALSNNQAVTARGAGPRGYEENLQVSKQIAKENPKLVANVVTSWVSNNG